jgi:hypothetical protein
MNLKGYSEKLEQFVKKLVHEVNGKSTSINLALRHLTKDQDCTQEDFEELFFLIKKATEELSFVCVDIKNEFEKISKEYYNAH